MARFLAFPPPAVRSVPVPAALLALAAPLMLAGCVSDPAPGQEAVAAEPEARPVAGPPPGPETAPAISAPAPRAKPARAKVATGDFIGRPPAALEALAGAPDFVRQEGAGEFRRYDRGACRLYAVVTADEGGRALIRSLSVSAAVAGAPSPDLGDCLSGAG